MKTNRLFFILAAIIFISVACGPDIKIPQYDYDTGNNSGGSNNNDDDNQTGGATEEDIYTVKYPEAGVTKVKTLQTTGYFSERTIAQGITHYSFYGIDDVTKANQNVNVLEVDLNNPKYKINFYFTSRNTTSNVGKVNKAIAAINAAYEQEAIYNRTNGVNHSEVTIRPTDPVDKSRRFWKHEAALVGDGKRKLGIINGAKGTKSIEEGGYQAIEVYKKLKERNIYASAPLLIEDYEPVGTSFVPAAYDDFSIRQFESSFHAEDYRRHQGVRHPRTAVAITEDNDLLLITVDGRFPGKAEGMSARELTKFIAKHFNPQWAINMDGGGSTTMYIKGCGNPNDVINYPCDDGNGVWDHVGERYLSTFLLVQYDE